MFVLLGKRVVKRAKNITYQQNYINTTQEERASDYKIIAIASEVEVITRKNRPLTGRTSHIEQLKQRIKKKAGRDKHIFVAAENEEGKVVYLFLPIGSIEDGMESINQTISNLTARPDANFSAGNGLAVITNENTSLKLIERDIDGQSTKVYVFKPHKKFLNKS